MYVAVGSCATHRLSEKLHEQSFSLFDLFLFVCVDDNCVFDLSRGDIHIHDDAMYIV